MNLSVSGEEPVVEAQPASWFVERYSIEPIPADERHGKLWMAVTVWAAQNSTPQTIAAGAVGIALGLPIWACLLGIVIGSVIGGALSALHAEQGPRLGLPQMVQSRAQFGFYGSLLPSLGAVLTCYVYTTLTEVLAVQGLSALFGWSPVVSVVVAITLGWIVAVLGYRAIHATNAVISVISVVLFLMFSSRLAGQVPQISYSGEFAWPAFLALLVFHIVGQLGNATFISDYTRYFPADTKGSHVFLAAFAGGTGSAILMTAVGMVAAALNFNELNVNTLAYMGSLFPGISTLIVILLTFSVIFIGAMGLYSFNQTAVALFTSRGGGGSAVLSRAIITGLLGIAGGVTALSVSENFIGNMAGLATTVVYFLVPWSAINLTDFYFVRRGRYDVDAIADRNGHYGLFNWRAMTVFVLGLLVQIPFVTSTYPRFIGIIASALDGLNFAWLVGFVFSALLYWLWMRRDSTSATALR